MATKKKKKEIPDKFINRVFYSAGSACLRIKKTAKKIDWEKASASIKDSSKIILDGISIAVNEFKETASTISKSFRAGYEASDDIKSCEDEKVKSPKRRLKLSIEQRMV